MFIILSKYHNDEDLHHVISELEALTEVNNGVGDEGDSEDYVQIKGRSDAALASGTASMVDYELTKGPTVEIVPEYPVLIEHENSDRESENIHHQIYHQRLSHKAKWKVLQIQGIETRLHPINRLKTDVTPEVNERIVPDVSENEVLGLLILHKSFKPE